MPLVRLGISSGKNWHHWFEELSSGFKVPSPIRDVCSCKADARDPVRFRRSTQLRDGFGVDLGQELGGWFELIQSDQAAGPGVRRAPGQSRARAERLRRQLEGALRVRLAITVASAPALSERCVGECRKGEERHWSLLAHCQFV